MFITSVSADVTNSEGEVMVRTAQRAMVFCAALAAVGAALTTPAQAAGADSAAPAAVTSDVTTLSKTCRTVKDINPWTYISGSCKRSALLPKEFYSAWLTCVDVRINRQYPVFGTQYMAPWGFYGSTSTARCDPGDYAIAGGVS
ncbi:hypothetical protein P3102_07735 [Amycolatopsis sp. QT-25]|uniref:hypothetical protein n=1 Tax=Amycolatopsis sp. QT-25 TaxID=3034022 RepID=UPI0023EB120F|nr:hypothetical protein [Amycolatopsis sp. QT-25]WET81105.1 hypothetical protein P3102_07735 [Amycolatopsis sp. QT-25]